MKQTVPGFAACIKMMRQHNPQVQEDGFHQLLRHASEYVSELLAEFRSETGLGLRCWLLELIGAAKSPEVFPLLTENLHSDDESLRHWAVFGLEHLNTKEARTILQKQFGNSVRDIR